MESLADSVFWELEVSFYLQAVQHGVKPVRSAGFSSVPHDPANPMYAVNRSLAIVGEQVSQLQCLSQYPMPVVAAASVA